MDLKASTISTADGVSQAISHDSLVNHGPCISLTIIVAEAHTKLELVLMVLGERRKEQELQVVRTQVLPYRQLVVVYTI